MFEHLIALGSSYTEGKRIGFHKASEEICFDDLYDFKKINNGEMNNKLFSFHFLTTDSESWESVVNKDSYFKNLYLVDSWDDFLFLINEDRKIKALDIAKYLLALEPMTNLKLQKMVYFVYADYLTRTANRLFDEKIIAYPYGPVIKEIYNEYKSNGCSLITDECNERKIILDDIKTPMVLSKILKSEFEEEVLKSINSTVRTFGKMTASQLVDITHREGSPWSKTPNRFEITDELIKEAHYIETV